APRVRGRSRWQVGVAIPRAQRGAAAGARLQLRSSLEGTALDLPEPLAKPAAASLPATIATTLPLGEGEITVDLGGRLALRARSTGAGTGVRVALGASRVERAPPATGLAASGHAPVLDALGWATLAAGAGDDTGGADAMPLRGVDVSAQQLQLLGARFADVRLRADGVEGATDVRFEGDALSGALRIPRERAGSVSGSFARQHSPAPPPQDEAVAATAASPPAPPPTPTDDRDAIDPANVPPLSLDVEDFRFGSLALGRLELRTRQGAAGLEVERLQTRSPQQSLVITGSWTG